METEKQSSTNSGKNDHGRNKTNRTHKAQESQGAIGREESGAGEPKTLGGVLAENLTSNTQESIDRVAEHVTTFSKKIKDYVQANPTEAFVLGVTIGLAGWAVLSTKPGRNVLEKSAGLLVPEVSKWIKQTFAMA